jgi:hypothetical protein
VRRFSPVGAAHGDVEIPHPIAKCDGPICRSGDWTAVDGGQLAFRIVSATARCNLGL